MSNCSAKRTAAWLASILIAVAFAVPTSQATDANDPVVAPSGFASIAFEGGPPGASYHLDGHALSIPAQPGGSVGPLVVKSGQHVIEVRQGENVLFHEEVSLEANETRKLLVPKAK